MAKKYFVSGTGKGFDTIVEARKEAYKQYNSRYVSTTVYLTSSKQAVGHTDLILNSGMIIWEDDINGIRYRLYPSGKVDKIDMMPRGFYKR